MRTVNRLNLSDKLTLFDITALGIGVFLYTIILSLVTMVIYQVFRYHYNIAAILNDFLIQSPTFNNFTDFIKTYSFEVSAFYLYGISGVWATYHATKSTFRNCTARPYQLNNNSNFKNLCFAILMNLNLNGVNYFYTTVKNNLQHESVLTFITNKTIDSMQEWPYNPLKEIPYHSIISSFSKDTLILLLSSLIVTIIMTYLWLNTPLLGSRIYPERIQRNQSQ